MTRLLTPNEMAERLGIEPRTVLKWAREGKIPAVKPSPKIVRFEEDQVFDALRSLSDVREGK